MRTAATAASEAARWMWHNLKVQTKLFHFTGGNVLGPFTLLFSSFVSPSLRPSLSLPSLPPSLQSLLAVFNFVPLFPHPLRPVSSSSFPPLLPSHPHIYHYFSSARSPARPSPPRLLLRVSTPQSSPSNPVNSSQ